MVERLVWVVIIAVSAVITWRVYNQRAVKRLSRQLANAPTANPLLSGLPALSANAQAILYFTTQYCAPCRTQQTPTLKQLETEFGDRLQVIQIDCEQQPDIADRWGVFSTPTTFVLNAKHQPVAVNRGLASALILRRQMQVGSDQPVISILPEPS